MTSWKPVLTSDGKNFRLSNYFKVKDPVKLKIRQTNEDFNPQMFISPSLNSTLKATIIKDIDKLHANEVVQVIDFISEVDFHALIKFRAYTLHVPYENLKLQYK